MAESVMPESKAKPQSVKNSKLKKTEGRQHLALIPSERDRERQECG